MLDFLRQLDIRTAGMLAMAAMVITGILHGLIVFKVIPYTWVLGGKSKSFDAAKQASIGGIISFVVMAPILLIASNLVAIPLTGILTTIFSIILWGLAVLLLANFVMQLLGTAFEKCVTSVLVGVMLISVIRIALG